MTDLDEQIADCPYCDAPVNLEEGGCDHFVSPEDEDAFNGAYWKLFPYAEDAFERCKRDIAHNLLKEVEDDEAKKLTQIDWFSGHPIECLAGYDPLNNGDGGFYSENKVAFRRLCELMDTVAKRRDDKVKNILEDYRRFQNAWHQLYERFGELLKEGGDKNSLWSYFCSFAPNKSFEKELQSVGSPEDRDACAAIFRLFQSRGGHRDQGWDSLQDFESLGVLALNHPEKISEVTNTLSDLVTNEAEAYKAAQSKQAKVATKNKPKQQTAERPSTALFADKVEAGGVSMSAEGLLHPMATAAFLKLLDRTPLRAEELVDQPVAILGEGPWPSEQLGQMLKRKRVYAISLKASVQAVIVGRSNVDTASIEGWLGETYAMNKVYPQELFALYVLTGIDPLQVIDKEHADQWIREHPVLHELFGDPGVDRAWSFLRSTEQTDEEFDEDQEVIHLPEGESPLVKMGYIVGTHFGLPPSERREILKRAFEGGIPRATNHENIEEYMKQWGAPGTSQRLWRIAKHLAGQIYLKRRNPTMEVAVSEWSADLKWLHKHVYPRVRYRFRWPRDFD